MLNMKPSEIRTKIIEGNKLALKRLVERKKKENSFLIISNKGKVAKIMARDIKL